MKDFEKKKYENTKEKYNYLPTQKLLTLSSESIPMVTVCLKENKRQKEKGDNRGKRYLDIQRFRTTKI